MKMNTEIGEESADGMLVAEFTLGDAVFGVDARLVQEVVKVGELTRVHGAPADVVGIRNLRGRIVTVVDMAAHMGLGRIEVGPETRMLIMEHQGEYYGLLVDSVTEAIALDEASIAAPPASLSTALRSRLIGTWRNGQALTAILDPAALFIWNEE
jgi:purine-binding chemotaxis protein CheW